MNIGVFITKGPQSWQIIQQENGKADIELQGYVRNVESPVVYCRVVQEDTNMPVVQWTTAQYQKENEWRTVLCDVPAGGLYRIETTAVPKDQRSDWGKRGDSIFHIGVGDVFIIAGQSNSVGYGKNPAFDPPELGIHIFRNNNRWDLAAHPFNDSTDSVHDINCEQENPGHSPYLTFAKVVKKAMNYPIGFIQTAKGGSPLSEWNPKERGNLYRNMLDIVRETGSKAAGVVWYQGCADTITEKEANSYLDRFAEMADALRYDLKNADLPIFTAQLNRLLGPEAGDRRDDLWSAVREAQRKAAGMLHHVYVIPTTDLPLSDGIHNNSNANMIIGERMGYMALNKLYHKNVMCDAPDVRESWFEESGRIRVRFNVPYGVLDTLGIDVEKLPLSVFDDLGPVELEAYSNVFDPNRGQWEYTDTVDLLPARKTSGKVYVNGNYGHDPVSKTFIDSYSGLPILSFCRLIVEDKK